MGSDEHIIHAAAALLHSDQPFCIVRFPGDSDFVLFTNPTLQKPAGADYFVVKPWESSEYSVWYFSDKENLAHGCVDVKKPAIQAETTFDQYALDFKHYQKTFAASSLEKAILSRIVNVDRPAQFDPLGNFQILSANYPKACVYLMLHPEAGLWTGASPEILLQKSKGMYQTMSLAGTQIFSENISWAEKEIREQAMVSQHISETLQNFGVDDFEQTGPKTYQAGNVVHLRTDFSFRGKTFQDNPDRLLQALHPTPAIAGYPVADSLELISRTERHSRRLYTGYFGRSITNSGADFYVNLRCMQIFQNVLSVYVGGGITKDSFVESEWQETSDKAQTLLARIHD